MINKIRKYLLRYKEIVPAKINESGSEYFYVSNSVIRLSTHIATYKSYPDELNIIVQKDSFVVFLGNHLININDYELFKQYIKHHIFICDALKDVINTGLNRNPNNVVREETDNQEKDNTSVVIEGTKMFVATIPFKGDYVFQRNDMQPNQLYLLSDSQLNWLEGKNFKNKDAATEYLKHIRTRIKKQKA